MTIVADVIMFNEKKKKKTTIFLPASFFFAFRIQTVNNLEIGG